MNISSMLRLQVFIFFIFLFANCSSDSQNKSENLFVNKKLFLDKKPITAKHFFIQIYEKQQIRYVLKAKEAVYLDKKFIHLKGDVFFADYRKKEEIKLLAKEAKIVLNNDVFVPFFALNKEHFDHILFEQEVHFIDFERDIKTQDAKYELRSNYLTSSSSVKIRHKKGAVLYGDSGFFLDMTNGSLNLYGKVVGEVQAVKK